MADNAQFDATASNDPYIFKKDKTISMFEKIT